MHRNLYLQRDLFTGQACISIYPLPRLTFRGINIQQERQNELHQTDQPGPSGLPIVSPGPSGSTQTCPHPLSQHLADPAQSWSSSHSRTQWRSHPSSNTGHLPGLGSTTRHSTATCKPHANHQLAVAYSPWNLSPENTAGKSQMCIATVFFYLTHTIKTEAIFNSNTSTNTPVIICQHFVLHTKQEKKAVHQHHLTCWSNQ